MTPAQATRAALLVDNIKEVETFLDKRPVGDSRNIYVTAVAGLNGRPDQSNVMSLKLNGDDAEPLLRMLATTMRVELEELGVS